MCLPKPVVMTALVAAYFAGLFLVWYEQQNAKSVSGRASGLIDKNVINERLA